MSAAAILLAQALPFLSCTFDAGGVMQPAIVHVDCGPTGRGTLARMESGRFYAGELAASVGGQALQRKPAFLITAIGGDVLPWTLVCWDRGARILCGDRGDLTEQYWLSR